MSEQEMRSMLLECGALQEGAFADGEGRDLRYRVEMTRLYQQPGQMGRVMDAFAQRFAGQAIDVVAGVDEEGIIPAYALAERLQAQCVYMMHRNGALAMRRELSVQPGQRVLILRDATLTGRRSREAVELLRAMGATIAGVASLVDLSGGTVRFRFPFTAMLTLDAGRAARR